jgi:RNA recognition motif-containing protein
MAKTVVYLQQQLELDNWFCVVSPPPVLLRAGGLSFAGESGESGIKMEVRLYVGNLAKSTTEDELKTLFAQAGAVGSVEVIKDRASGESKGFAFITMGDQSAADKAISMFNAYSLKERELKVNVAKPKVERS